MIYVYSNNIRWQPIGSLPLGWCKDMLEVWGILERWGNLEVIRQDLLKRPLTVSEMKKALYDRLQALEMPPPPPPQAPAHV